MLRVYSYKGCDACRKARKWLQERGIAFEELPIREQPPSEAELKAMLESYGGEMKRLFNISGQDYRSLGLKEKLAGMTEKEAFELLGSNGNLVKRPFVIGDAVSTVGFKPADWEMLFD